MTAVSGFDRGAQAGKAAIGRFEDSQDQSKISEIFKRLQDSDDPNPASAITEILSSVSKKNQTEPIKVLQEFQKQSQKKAPLTLNESLNQAEKRYKNTTSALRLPFEKSDNFGNIFLDFEQDESKRTKVLDELDKELTKYHEQIAREYKKAGAQVPQDVIDAINDSVQVKVGEEVVNLDVAKQIEQYTKDYPPAKYKGKTVPSGDGQFELTSDGKKWTVKKVSR